MCPSIEASLCFSNLPEDVGQLVFELTAELDQETGRSCALVSRKVNTWVEPILYRTLIIQYPGQLEKLCEIVEDINGADPNSTKSADFFASHVKAILITESCHTNLLSILKACHNVEILALWGTSSEYDSEGPAQSNKDLRDFHDFLASPELSPRWISIGSDILPINKVRFSYPIFQNVTHAELVWGSRNGDSDEVQWDTLRYLPFLTHFSVFSSLHIRGCGRWVQETVDLCPRSLRVFILWIYPASFLSHTSEEFEGVKGIQDGDIDSRAVVAYMGNSLPTPCDLHPILRSYDDGVRDCAGVPVGKDFWTLAEEFIEERLRQREKQKIGSAA
ncbi:hypothetical protein H1R20_g4733, partial [Candolleomyces eurysporus]